MIKPNRSNKSRTGVKLNNGVERETRFIVEDAIDKFEANIISVLRTPIPEIYRSILIL